MLMEVTTFLAARVDMSHKDTLSKIIRRRWGIQSILLDMLQQLVLTRMVMVIMKPCGNFWDTSVSTTQKYCSCKFCSSG